MPHHPELAAALAALNATLARQDELFDRLEAMRREMAQAIEAGARSRAPAERAAA